jgi:Uma2 family endonuclease
VIGQNLRRRFTVHEYRKMVDAGILQEDDRVELLSGEIYHIPALEPAQAATVMRLNHLFHRLIGDHGIISIDNPIQLDEYNEPQPHFTILRWQDDFYAKQLPTPPNILLLIEMATTTVNAKLSLYAGAGIPELWIVNCKERMIAQYTQPDGDLYANRQLVKRGTITTTCLSPAVEVPVEHIFGLKVS